ncbi:hypothetical protein FRB90_005211 [Tulasnella sp. 427]|nr:hypothetical protein FRB90_005211 [Tulasnella sp. 427]
MGAFFIWENGEQKCNQPGIDRIKFIVDEAKKRGIYVQLTLTNNWSPDFPSDSKFPPGYLSNSFGGIDTYVQQTHPGGDHDLFFTDETVKGKYKTWLQCIIPQLSSCEGLFAWELANDPRCKGAKGRTTSGNCNPQTITRWTADLSKYVKQLDPNHMAASGDHGFYCVDCPKLFPRTAPATVSGGSQSMVGKRAKRRNGYLTAAMVRAQIKAREKEEYRAKRNAPGAKRSIRGSWAAPASTFKRLTTRQDSSSVGPAYDGSYSGDTEDIANIPTIDCSTFQFFPDQNTYNHDGSVSPGPPEGGAGGSNFKNTLQTGIDWITNHADTCNTFNKPCAFTAFGLVDGDSSGNFVPFDSTSAQDVTVDPSYKRVKRAQDVANNSEQDTAYNDWGNSAVSHGINSITGYQRGQSNLSGRDSSHHNSGSDSSGHSPDDGYRISRQGTQTIFKNIGRKQKSKSGGSDSS